MTTTTATITAAASHNLFIFDLDGTLAMPSQEASPRAKKALGDLAATGATIVIATGRTLNAAFALLTECESGYVVASNGGVVGADPGNEVLTRTVMPPELIRELITIGRDHGMFIVLFRTHSVLMQEPGPAAEAMRRGNSNVDTEFGEPEDADFSDVLKVMFWAEKEVLDRELEAMRGKQPGIVRSLANVAEMSTPGAEKDGALQWLAEHTDVDLKEAVGVGDSGNDMGWLPLVGMSIAPSDAIPDVIDIVDVVLDGKSPKCVIEFIEAVTAERTAGSEHSPHPAEPAG